MSKPRPFRFGISGTRLFTSVAEASACSLEALSGAENRGESNVRCKSQHYHGARSQHSDLQSTGGICINIPDTAFFLFDP